MSGPLGIGSGGGSGGGKDVLAGTGISVSGTTAFTVDNTGVLSLAGSGVSVSSSTGNVTVTGPTISGGTGISVAGGGTTSLTVSATGVNTVSAGTGISVSGTTSLTVSNTGVTSLAGSGVSVSAATGAVTVTAPTVTGGTGISVSGSGTTSLTVSATGVQSLTAGTGISVSGTTTPTITNSGVTSIVAGTNVTVSGATGAVTVNAPGFATPGSSAIGDTAAAGTATTVSRSDHVHGREAAGTPGASAVGDTASAGVATTVARSDHRHSREAFGTPVALSASVTDGSATTVARSDHQHGGTVAFPTGSASAPSITPSGDADTGIWSPAANTLALSTGGVERVRLRESGSYGLLGINTTPSATVHLVGGTYAEVLFQATGTGAGKYTMGTANNSASDATLRGAWYLYDETAGASRFNISSTGTITALGVYSATVGATNRDVYVDSTGLLGYVSSLRDQKQDITPATTPSWLMQLSPVTFKYKDDETKSTQLGLIAEDVEVIAPELCFYDDITTEMPRESKDDPIVVLDSHLELRGVQYSKLIVPLLSAVQDLTKAVKSLQDRVNMLENSVS